MGLLLSIALAFFLDKIFGSRLIQGKYSLQKTFWIYGVLGSLAIIAISATYVSYVASGDQSSGAGWTIAAIRAVGAPIAVYAFVVFLGIWRSARNSPTLTKIIVRYFSLFYLSTAAACVLWSWLNLIILAAVYFLRKHLEAKKLNNSRNSEQT